MQDNRRRAHRFIGLCLLGVVALVGCARQPVVAQDPLVGIAEGLDGESVGEIVGYVIDVTLSHDDGSTITEVVVFDDGSIFRLGGFGHHRPRAAFGARPEIRLPETPTERTKREQAMRRAKEFASVRSPDMADAESLVFSYVVRTVDASGREEFVQVSPLGEPEGVLTEDELVAVEPLTHSERWKRLSP